MARLAQALIFLWLFEALAGIIWACELDQAHNGCKIESRICKCAFGCKSEYRYKSNQECKNALRERGNNICNQRLCRNNGTCIQVSHAPRYKCQCYGTGFYGERCERACHPAAPEGNMPIECLVI